MPHDGAEGRGDGALHDGAGEGDPAHGEQFFEVEVQPDAEQEQDDADLGHLLGEVAVGDEAGRVGPDGDAGKQITDQGRQAESVRDVAQRQGRRQAAGEGEDQGQVVVHAVPSASRADQARGAGSGRRSAASASGAVASQETWYRTAP